MRKCIPSKLRSSRPLRVELFETRCLLSSSSILQAPALLASPLFNSTTMPVAEVTPGVQTATSLLNGIGGAVSTPNLNPVLDIPIAAAGTKIASSSQTVTGLASVTTSATSGLVSGGLPVNPVEIVTGLTAGILPIRAVVNLEANDSGINAGLGQTTSPLVSVKLDPQAADLTSITVVVQGEESQNGPQGILLAANGAIVLNGERFPVGRVVNPGSSGPILHGNGTLGGGLDVSLGNAVAGPSSGGDERPEIGPSGFEVNVSMPLEADPESDMGMVSPQLHSSATPAAHLEHPPVLAFIPLPLNTPKAIVMEVAGEADSVEPDSPEAVIARQVTPAGGVSDTDGDSPAPAPAPQSEGVLADLLPLDLASLEADIQTFLEQVEQLGAELSSMLGRMNLSPVLMAVAIAALAGEIARRRVHRPQRGSLLACCAGAAVEWLPGLTDPWSAENP